MNSNPFSTRIVYEEFVGNIPDRHIPAQEERCQENGGKNIRLLQVDKTAVPVPVHCFQCFRTDASSMFCRADVILRPTIAHSRTVGASVSEANAARAHDRQVLLFFFRKMPAQPAARHGAGRHGVTVQPLFELRGG